MNVPASNLNSVRSSIFFRLFMGASSQSLDVGKRSIWVFLILLLFTNMMVAKGASIYLPNNSSESPQTLLATPSIDEWQKAPEPVWYNGGGGFPWEQTMGQFLNTTNGSADHIDNMDGEQGAYLFALPDLSIFQDDNTIAGTNAASHNFQARFEAGKSYALTVGLLGGGGGMTNGATFEISLYYRDASSNAITVAATSITSSSDLFPTNTHLTDFQVILPTVKASDAWAGKNIGIRLASTVGFDLQGGYWDLDNVRLTESLVPNNSFESPQTLLATPSIDEWRKRKRRSRCGITGEVDFPGNRRWVCS